MVHLISPKEIAQGAAVVALQDNPPACCVGIPFGSRSCPSCSISNAALCLLPGKAVEKDPNPRDPTPMLETRGGSWFLGQVDPDLATVALWEVV